ncbi:hypothetical protein [Candidatus Nitronereus thalassa]|uniref:Uncharacterized protein n=1 Tax=Candidatus Nitronereus thalassa TaxID=3020898 RepID=A0ABU3K3A2_9BACT|nr:hypothetical protein [Candidatus Nitronereus thalassa]MDT7040875.1 hypothetical protein [Candidatus Nitronereus thalassa]
MPRTAIPVQEIEGNANEEIVYTAGDAANDMLFQNNGRTLLICKNGSVGAIQLTIVSVPDPVLGRTEDIVQSIPAGDDFIVGFLKPSGWNQKSGADAGKVYVNLDDDTSVSVAALSIKGA